MASVTNKYVQRAALNGQKLGRAWLWHAEVARGGRLVLWMSDKPSRGAVDGGLLRCPERLNFFAALNRRSTEDNECEIVRA